MTALLVASLLGQSCIAQSVSYAPAQYAQSYAVTPYMEKTVFVAVEEPTSYYAGLVGQQQRQAERQAQAQQVQSLTDQKIDRLAAALEAIQKRLETQPNVQQPQPPQLLPEKPAAPVQSQGTAGPEGVPLPPTVTQAAARATGHPGLASLTKSCAGCHQGAASKGGGVVLFAADGSFVATDPEDLDRIERSIRVGRMPKRPNNPLTLAEYATIRDYLGEQSNRVALNSGLNRK